MDTLDFRPEPPLVIMVFLTIGNIIIFGRSNMSTTVYVPHTKHAVPSDRRRMLNDCRFQFTVAIKLPIITSLLCITDWWHTCIHIGSHTPKTPEVHGTCIRNYMIKLNYYNFCTVCCSLLSIQRQDTSLENVLKITLNVGTHELVSTDRRVVISLIIIVPGTQWQSILEKVFEWTSSRLDARIEIVPRAETTISPNSEMIQF